MAAIVDTLETRLQTVGVREFVSEMATAGGAIALFGAKLDDAGKRSIAFGAAAGGAAIIIGHQLIELAKGAGEEAATFERASNNFKGSFSVDELQAFTTQMEDLTGVADDQVASFLGLLGTFRVTKDQAQQLALPILDAAEGLKALGLSREQLANSVGKALETGNAGALKRSGIVIDEIAFKAANAADRVNLIAKALEEQGPNAAAKFRQTLPGALQAAASSADNLKDALGAPLVGPLNAIVNQTERWTRALTNADPVVKGVVTTVAVGAVVALGAYAIATTGSAIATAYYTRELVKLTAAHVANAAAASADAGATAGAGAANAGAAGAAGGRGGFLGGFLRFAGVAAAEAAAQAGKAKGGFAGGAAFTAGRAAEGAIIGGGFAGAPGAIVGGILGSLEAAIESTADAITGKKKANPADDPVVAELKRQTDLLQKQLAAAQGSNSAGAGFSPKDIPIMVQRATSRATRV